MAKKERLAASQATVVDAKDAPEGANVPLAPVKAVKETKLPKGKLFVVVDAISGKTFSSPIPEKQAQDTLKRVEEKEKREHSAETQYDFSLEEYKAD